MRYSAFHGLETGGEMIDIDECAEHPRDPTHEELIADGYTLVGYVIADSGSVTIDESYAVEHEPKHGEVPAMFERRRTEPVGPRTSVIQMQTGVYCMTAYGDGTFPVYAKFAHSGVTELRVIFDTKESA